MKNPHNKTNMKKAAIFEAGFEAGKTMTPKHIKKKLIEWVKAHPYLMKRGDSNGWFYAQHLLGYALGSPKWYNELVEEVWLKYRK